MSRIRILIYGNLFLSIALSSSSIKLPSIVCNLTVDKSSYGCDNSCWQVLKAFHYPVTVTLVQFAVGSVLVLFMWGLNLYKRPKITGAQVLIVLKLYFDS